MTTTVGTNNFYALEREWRLQLCQWATSGILEAAALEALNLRSRPAALEELISQWTKGDYSGLPPIELLSANDIPGAAGAYAASTGTIYLNREWLAGASSAQAIAVLTEELGHHLDVLLNTIDTPGDEGELFARLLTDKMCLNEYQRSVLLAEIDQGQVCLNGELLTVEQSATVKSTPIALANPGRTSHEYQNYNAIAVLKSDGSVVTWGDSSGGGDSTTVASKLSSKVIQIFSNRGAFSALKSDGSVVTWGNKLFGGDSSNVSESLSQNVTKISSSLAAFAAVKSDGSVITWGDGQG